ncbi:hypothetical protein [Chryseobacterium sp. GP-SGM7]|uniref:hypothetical protein n=1 Tax=Chryseobacterium sp. GP-SGM7 TaxID=3411323 RepID=UPI003B95B05F
MKIKFHYQYCFLFCFFSIFLFSQKVDIYNDVSIIGKTSVSGEKNIYKYIRNNNEYIAFRLKRDSVSKLYNYDGEVISIKKDFDTIKIINPKDKKLHADFERLKKIEEKYTYYHKDSIFLTNAQKRKYQRLLNKINSTSENNLKIKLKNEFTVTIDGTAYTFNLSIINVKKSIGIYGLTKKEYPLLYNFLIFTKKYFLKK